MYLVGGLMSLPMPKGNPKLANIMNEGMLMPYNAVLEKAKKKISEDK